MRKKETTSFVSVSNPEWVKHPFLTGVVCITSDDERLGSPAFLHTEIKHLVILQQRPDQL